MKTVFLKSIMNTFTFSTLKRRIVLSLTAGVLLCCVLMAIVSYNAIYTMQQNKIKTSILFDLDQQSTLLTQTYTNLLQITQQMSPDGNIGSLVEEYFAASEPYSRSVLSKKISSNIGLITFSNPNVEMVMYYQPSDGRIEFNDFPPRDDFSLQVLPDLISSVDVTYQSPHPAQCRFSGDQVVSVTRRITFSNNSKWIIYVEAKSEVAADIGMLSQKGNMPYTLLLLDQGGQVKYSTDPGAFPYGKLLELNGESGTMGGYIWNQKQSPYGFGVTLLIPAASYNRELYTWTNHMFLILGIALLIMAFTAVMLWQLIYKPLRVFEFEMEAMGKGNMDFMQYRTGLDEFDRLFDQFNSMKQQIQQLLLAVAQKEQRRHQLEIEKLAYQINPHFLLNALNSVHWLAVMHKQPEIDKFISTLNFLLSYNLGKSKESATLRTEIKVLQAYLDLQQMRYDFGFVLNIVEGEYLDSPVARFILQPIAENAICHGLDENGRLEVNISQDEASQTIRILIRDDGRGLSAEMLAALQQPDMPDQQQMGRGIGLRYVRMMLESFYGDSACMYIDSAPQQGTAVNLHLPFRKESMT
jgi:two-component system, sensor histidine kinase YesM